MSERVDWFLGSHSSQEEKLKEMGQKCRGREGSEQREHISLEGKVNRKLQQGGF